MGNIHSNGFTMIEMVVVIALISILAAVALPKMLDTYDNAHEAAVFGAGGAMASAVVLTARIRLSCTCRYRTTSTAPWRRIMPSPSQETFASGTSRSASA